METLELFIAKEKEQRLIKTDPESMDRWVGVFLCLLWS